MNTSTSPFRKSLQVTYNVPFVASMPTCGKPIARETPGIPEAPFTGENAFLGDYEWCSAYGGRVYGIWAEAAPEGYEVSSRGRGAAAAERPRTPTIIRVGIADFKAAGATSR